MLGGEGDAHTIVEGDGVRGEEAMWDASAMKILHTLCGGGQGVVQGDTQNNILDWYITKVVYRVVY